MKSSLSSSSIACYIHTLAPIWFHTICMDNMRYYTSDRTNVKCCVFVYRLPAYKLNIKPKCIYRSGIEWGTPCSKHKYRCCIENEIILYPFAVVQHLQFLFRIHNHVQTFIRQTGTEFIIRTIWPIVCVCVRERESCMSAFGSCTCNEWRMRASEKTHPIYRAQYWNYWLMGFFYQFFIDATHTLWAMQRSLSNLGI